MGEEDEVSIADVAKMICDAMEFKGFLTLNVGVGRGQVQACRCSCCCRVDGSYRLQLYQSWFDAVKDMMI